MSIKYSVVVEKFAERHYIKTFAKNTVGRGILRLKR